MRTKNSSYFEGKIRIERETADGTPAKVNELYVVDSMSFSETEAKLLGFIGTECEVLTESRAKYREIFFSDVEGEETFYKVGIDCIILDENSGKEKHAKSQVLVQGSSIESAKANVDEVMGDAVQYKITSVVETAIQEYIC